MQELFQQFLDGLKATSALELIAALSGIVSVWFSRKESVLTYPIGLINTTFYIYLSFEQHLLGEASVNFYYTIMSIYGWWLWTRKDQQHRPVVHITYSSPRDWRNQFLFFGFFYIAIFTALQVLKAGFASGAIPWADAFASATAYTGMWLMAKKKVESWYWWLATNIASIPLYFVKNLMVTSVYYTILLIMAFWGLAEWKKKANHQKTAGTA